MIKTANQSDVTTQDNNANLSQIMRYMINMQDIQGNLSQLLAMIYDIFLSVIILRIYSLLIYDFVMTS